MACYRDSFTFFFHTAVKYGNTSIEVVSGKSSPLYETYGQSSGDQMEAVASLADFRNASETTVK
jgi:hypothetical protein